jgi:hypothetical protein
VLEVLTLVDIDLGRVEEAEFGCFWNAKEALDGVAAANYRRSPRLPMAVLLLNDESIGGIEGGLVALMSQSK